MKGQVALEYFVTYAWALFALTVLLSILFMYLSTIGITLREYCLFPSQIICHAFWLKAEEPQSLKLNISNNFGFMIRLNSAELKYKGKHVILKPKKLLKQGESIILDFPLEGIRRGEKGRAEITLNYTPCFTELCVKESFVVKGVVVARAT